MAQERTAAQASPWLLVVALFGLIVPNGLFIHAVLFQHPDLRSVLGDHLTLGFMLDALLALGVIGWWLARTVGAGRAWLFVGLSFLGGLGFSLPIVWWWEERAQKNRVSESS